MCCGKERKGVLHVKSLSWCHMYSEAASLAMRGRPNLDFGRGFYVTDLREQAVSWAERQSAGRGLESLLNVYELDIDRVRVTYRCLRFEAYDEAWLIL